MKGDKRMERAKPTKPTEVGTYDLNLEIALCKRDMGSLLLYCENDVKETCRAFRRIFFSNNMLKRHHIPMRRNYGRI